jgi:cytochrome c-type biogenesis protein CcmH/NrfF
MSAFPLLIPLAHVGHWWTYVLYAVPVIIVLVSVALTVLRQRREGRDDPGER